MNCVIETGKDFGSLGKFLELNHLICSWLMVPTLYIYIYIYMKSDLLKTKGAFQVLNRLK
jgi:hypothetical protein